MPHTSYQQEPRFKGDLLPAYALVCWRAFSFQELWQTGRCLCVCGEVVALFLHPHTTDPEKPSFIFQLPSTIADASNKAFLQHDGAILLDERLHSELNTSCSVRDEHPTEAPSAVLLQQYLPTEEGREERTPLALYHFRERYGWGANITVVRFALPTHHNFSSFRLFFSTNVANGKPRQRQHHQQQQQQQQQQIDDLRRERVLFDTIYKKMERELSDRKKMMANVIEVC